MSIVANIESITTDIEYLLKKIKSDGDLKSSVVLGQAVENNIRDFIRNNLPPRFGIDTGLLVNEYEEYSPQMDIILYDYWNTPKIQTTSIRIPVDATLGTVELKRTLKASDITKTAENTKNIKLMKKVSLDKLTFDNQSNSPKLIEKINPLFSQCSLMGLYSKTSLLSLAKYWQKHYYDVPMGCQLDSVVVLDKGIINLASWDSSIQDNHKFRPTYLIHPAAFEEGESTLLFPMWEDDKKKPFKSVKVGPKISSPVGSVFFLGVTECGFYAFASWIRFFLQCCAGQISPEFIPQIGFYLDGLPEKTKTIFLPLAISGDTNKLENDDGNYAIEMALKLYLWFHNGIKNA
jgi:hypothetical protein